VSYRLSSPAEAELDDIWPYVARESESVDTAIRIVQGISDRFLLPATHSRMGRQSADLSPELRGFAASDYVILHSVEDDDTVHVHHVLHGSQEIESHFPH
jgi:plasmid stabilization system protein ParE